MTKKLLKNIICFFLHHPWLFSKSWLPFYHSVKSLRCTLCETFASWFFHIGVRPWREWASLPMSRTPKPSTTLLHLEWPRNQKLIFHKRHCGLLYISRAYIFFKTIINFFLWPVESHAAAGFRVFRLTSNQKIFLKQCSESPSWFA